ncbi:hypothetical protein AAGW05_16565 [Arthrobacter sp. LAPM80]|uniref:hypothetical protein n=1 Tax=Arthrobacter sp. LAPM80 TaxID=3141788 RepID=UPI00398A97CE
MEPAELAGMLAREIDIGVAVALRSIDAAGILAVDSIIARIGSTPRKVSVDWEAMTWQSEVIMHIDARRHAAAMLDPGYASLSVPEVVAALPVQALLGVGPTRDRYLASIGIRTVGQVASLHSAAVALWVAEKGRYAIEIVGRARALPTGWPPGIMQVVGSRSVLAVAIAGPDKLDGGDKKAAVVAWEACMRMSACLDQGVLAHLPARGLVRA